jgi:hypothetical protein
MPICWSDNNLCYLQGSQFLQIISDKKDQLYSDFVNAITACDELKPLTLQDYIWARTIVCTRNFAVKINNRKENILAPLADMMNHNPGGELATWSYDDHNAMFEVKAVRSIAPGAEITTSYGKKSNSRFLLSYGFTVEQHALDSYDLLASLSDCRILVMLSKDDIYYQVKRTLLGEPFWLSP